MPENIGSQVRVGEWHEYQSESVRILFVIHFQLAFAHAG